MSLHIFFIEPATFLAKICLDLRTTVWSVVFKSLRVWFALLDQSCVDISLDLIVS